MLVLATDGDAGDIREGFPATRQTLQTIGVRFMIPGADSDTASDVVRAAYLGE